MTNSHDQLNETIKETVSLINSAFSDQSELKEFIRQSHRIIATYYLSPSPGENVLGFCLRLLEKTLQTKAGVTNE